MEETMNSYGHLIRAHAVVEYFAERSFVQFILNRVGELFIG